MKHEITNTLSMEMVRSESFAAYETRLTISREIGDGMTVSIFVDLDDAYLKVLLSATQKQLKALKQKNKAEFGY